MSDYYSTNVDYGPLFSSARRGDPQTSHAAASQAVCLRSDHQRRILEALSVGPAGASGIASRCGLVSHQVNKRISELAKAGSIVETGSIVRSSSGRGEREWRVA